MSGTLWTRADDSMLIRLSRDATPVEEIAEQLGRSYGAVVTRRMFLKQEGRIKRLGYAGHREWTANEALELKERWREGKSLKWLAAHFSRTETAIKLKLKRLGIKCRRDRQTLTARDVARIMGVRCAKTVVYWSKLGWLPHIRDGRKQRDDWRFDPFALWGFVENVETHMAWDAERITDPDLREHAREIRAKSLRWLRIGEFAKLHHVNHQTVNDWIWQGKVPLDKVFDYGNFWIREDIFADVDPPYMRPRKVRRGYSRYLCCGRTGPADLAFAWRAKDRICDQCRPVWKELSNGSLMRVRPIRSAA